MQLSRFARPRACPCAVLVFYHEAFCAVKDSHDGAGRRGIGWEDAPGSGQTHAVYAAGEGRPEMFARTTTGDRQTRRAGISHNCGKTPLAF